MATKEKSPTTLRLDKQSKEEARLTPSVVDPLDAASEHALADVAAGRMTDYKDFEAYQRAMDKLSTITK